MLSNISQNSMGFWKIRETLMNMHLGFDEYLTKILNLTQNEEECVLKALTSVLHRRIKVYFDDRDPQEYIPFFCYNWLNVINVIYSE